MGQAQSGEPQAPRPHEELTRELANKFAEKCFTPLEIYSLKDVFKGLADHEQHVRYLKEDTIARFLEIPDILHASPVVFQMVSYIGAFPFLQDAPAVLGLEQLVMVITIMTERYRRVLVKGATDRRKLLFKSLAVYDRKLSEMTSGTRRTRPQKPEEDKEDDSAAQTAQRHVSGFAVDVAAGDDDDDDDNNDDLDNEDDELVLAAFESLDYVNVYKHGNAPTIHGAMIPADNFRKLVMLLLLLAPLDPQERLSSYSSRLSGDELDGLRATAENILTAFLNVERSPGIKFKHFNSVIPVSFPFMFNGFNPLFEHFLFSKDLDLSRRKDSQQPLSPATPPLSNVPLLQQETASVIMDTNILCQLSFFIPGSMLFRRLRLLYSGDDDGFSMGSFETRVFNWRAPTILLVRGSRLSAKPARKAEATFVATLPSKRLPPGSPASEEGGERLTFGLFVNQPWRHTNRECFGGEDTLLFQLEPVHDVFHASSVNRDWVSFIRPSAAAASAAAHAGIAVGCMPPTATQASKRSGAATVQRALGAVSLVLDSSFEFGCVTHDWTTRGGAFAPSVSRRFDFQERFAVDALEVWGCGGDAEAQHQAERWAWEAREAEARRRINLGTGDIEADRALLEMAGLVGANRSGGSMA